MINRLYNLLRFNGSGSGKTRDEIEFLPAALEIIEMPPNPAGRKTLWVIMTFFMTLIIWSLVSEIDIVAIAHGKVIPIGKTKSIQPVETSTVKAIHVREDQSVKKGQLLIELDNADHKADIIRMTGKREALASDIHRIDNLLNKIQVGDIDDGYEDSGTSVVLDEQLLLARIETEYQHIQAKLKSIEERINKGEAEYSLTQSIISKLSKTRLLVNERAQTYENAVSAGVISRNHWLQLEQERVEQDEELKIQHKRLPTIRASIEASKQEHKALEKQVIASLLEQKEEARISLAALNQEIIKTKVLHSRQHVRAPISGVVQQLNVHTVGGVVTTAQELMRIVPVNNQLEIEAYFYNRDIGYLKEGQSAEVKIDAFPFTRHGTMPASLETLSNDAILDENRGLVYAARVQIDEDIMHAQRFRLSPGMSVTVEVSTGTRRLIEYFLSPLLEYGDESIRER